MSHLTTTRKKKTCLFRCETCSPDTSWDICGETDQWLLNCFGWGSAPNYDWWWAESSPDKVSNIMGACSVVMTNLKSLLHIFQSTTFQMKTYSCYYELERKNGSDMFFKGKSWIGWSFGVFPQNVKGIFHTSKLQWQIMQRCKLTWMMCRDRRARPPGGINTQSLLWSRAVPQYMPLPNGLPTMYGKVFWQNFQIPAS